MNSTENKTERYAILGFPLEHSVSPKIHNRAFNDYGMNAHYGKKAVHPDEFDQVIPRLKKENWRGFNVTIPFKERILPFLDWIEETAKAIGAVNTIKVENGRWLGFNTDWSGFLRPIQEELPEFRRCLVLGAGGAARAVAFALVKEVKPEVLMIANRTKKRADALANELRKFGTCEIKTATPDSLEKTGEQLFDLIVNTTSVGMGDLKDQLVVEPAHFAHTKTLVYDLVYKPPLTLFLQHAQHAGLRTINGFPMLIYQAEEAFKIWTGKPYLPETLKALFQELGVEQESGG